MLLSGATTLRIDPVAAGPFASGRGARGHEAVDRDSRLSRRKDDRTPGAHVDREFGPVLCLEIVLVNDGSPDDSATVCRRLAGELPLVKFLNLLRNFSEHNAVMAGLNYATGDFVAIMDDDFQNPPGEVVKLVTEAERASTSSIRTTPRSSIICSATSAAG